MEIKTRHVYVFVLFLLVAACAIAYGVLRVYGERDTVAPAPATTEAVVSNPPAPAPAVTEAPVVANNSDPGRVENVPTGKESEKEEDVAADSAQSADEASDLPSCADLRIKWENGDWDQAGNVRQGLPQTMPGRSRVRTNGDTGIAFFYFSESYPSVTLHRAVPDDTFVWVIYCTDQDEAFDLLPLLNVQPVTPETVADLSANHKLALRTHSVELDGELLAQNLYEVYLGSVAPGAFIYFEVEDDPKLGSNDGVTADVVSDTTYYTYHLDGTPLTPEEMTFFPSEEAFGDVINEEEYAEWLATQK